MALLHILDNSYLQVILDQQQACWSLVNRLRSAPSLQNMCIRANYRRGRAGFSALGDWSRVRLIHRETIPSPHGPLYQLCLSFEPDENGLCFDLAFALPEGLPICLWNLRLENTGPQPVLVDRLDLLKFEHSSTFLNLQSKQAFFSNGWQSWSYTGTYYPGERFHRTRLGPLRAPTDVNAGTPHPRDPGHFSSNMFGVLCDRARRVGLLVGFLSQQEHFGSLEAWLRPSGIALNMWAHGDGTRLDPDCAMTTDWAILTPLYLDDPDPLGLFVEAVARQHYLLPPLAIGLNGGQGPEKVVGRWSSTSSAGSQEPGVRGAIPIGWCSWYQFSTDTYVGNITPQDIRENLHAVIALRSDLPLQIIQIDDGFEAQVGDWLAFNHAFSEGLAPLAKEISQTGLIPGLWLAPFIVHPRSRLAAEHPDWLLRGRFGRSANAGLFWDSTTTALDLTHPDVLDYVKQVSHCAVHEWGFNYLKLDFLYAGALPGRYRDPTRTRAQVLRSGLQALRQGAGDGTFLLACGCPLGPAIGLMDGMRIGSDTTRRWNPNFNGIEFFFKKETNLPSVRNATHNILTRAATHRRWWINDPDCLLVRPTTKLTLAEIQAVATTIALTGGALLLSDHLPDLPVERLHIAQVLLPLIDKRPRLLDLFDSSTPCRVRLDLEGPAGTWQLLGLFNWDDAPQDMILQLVDFDLDPDVSYIGREFWHGHVHNFDDGKLVISACPAHSVILLSLRTYTKDQPQYLGSDLHISQGLEVSAWQPKPGGLELRLERPGQAYGEIVLYLPEIPAEVQLEGQPAVWQPLEVEGCYRVEVKLVGQANLEIVYSKTSC